ncbi:MAG: hypothetical protein WC962_08350 [Phycisphaerae bacterium]
MSKSVPIAYGEKQAEIGAVSAMVFHIQEEDTLSLYDVETDAANPLQLNSTVVVTRASDAAVVFRGYVMSKPVMREFEQGAFMEVSCFGKEGVLTQTLCPHGGSFQYTEESSSIAVTAIVMQPSDAWEEYDDVSTLWPDPLAEGANWLQDADCPSDTLDAGILAGATDIILDGAGGGGFAPRGWVSIGTEWIYYPACWYNGTHWQLGDTAGGNPCVRGELGTTAAGHLAAVAVINKRVKTTAPGEVKLYDTVGGVTSTVPATQYSWNSSLGCLVLNRAAVVTDNFTADFNVYDEDGTLGGGTIVLLEDIVTDILTADNTLGGAGFAAGDITVTAPLGVNRFEYDPSTKQPYAWNVIQDLMDTLGINEEYALLYNHTSDKITFTALAQKLVADIDCDYVRRTDSDVTLEDVVSGVLVKYSDEAAGELCDNGRAWHRAAAANTHFMGDPDHPGFSDSAGRVNSDVAGNGGLAYCIDDKIQSCAGWEYLNVDPGASFNHSDWWFGAPVAGVPPIVRIETIALAVNTYRVAGSAWARTRYIAGDELKWEATVWGATDYNTGTHTATDWELCMTIRGDCNVNGGACNTVTVGGDEIPRKDVNALQIRFTVASGPKTAGDYYWGYVHHFNVTGTQSGSYLLVQTTDDVALQGNIQYVYAPLTHRKLRGGIGSSGAAGAPRCKMMDIGASNRAGAQSLGRALLVQRLLLYNSRSYEIAEFMGTLPEVGLTARVDDDEDGVYEYTGLIRGYNLTITPEETSVTLRLLDYNADMLE